MFFKKKPASSTIPPAGDRPPAGATEPPKAKTEKLPGPRPVPGAVAKQLTARYRINADIVALLKALARKRPERPGTFDIRVFDQSEAAAAEVPVKDYTSLDAHPELVLYEGWFDEDAKTAEIAEKNRMNYDVPIFSEAEIQQKIEALKEPGSSVFFYQARGPAHGGPLAMGAAIIELSPVQSKKKNEYNIYTANVIGMQPAAKRQKLYHSDKPKEIAKWVKEGHHKRMY